MKDLDNPIPKYFKVSVFALPITPAAVLKDKISLDEYLPEDITDESIESTRFYILEKLNKDKSVFDIRDLLTEDEKEAFPIWIHTYHAESFRRKPLKNHERYPIFSFNPIVFSYRMPAALQDHFFPREYLTEDFTVLIDGVLIFIAGKSPLTKVPSGIPDVRDRIAELINEPDRIKCESKGLGLAPSNFVFVPDLNVKETNNWNLLLQSDKPNEIDSNLRMLYRAIYSVSNELYDMSNYVFELNELTDELYEGQETVLKKLKEFVSMSSWRIFDKSNRVNEIEKTLIYSLSKYVDLMNRRNSYERMRSRFFKDLQSKNSLIGQIEDLDEVYEVPRFNEILFLEAFNKTYEIISKFSLNRTNIVAGAIGGVVTFILAQIVSHLLSLR